MRALLWIVAAVLFAVTVGLAVATSAIASENVATRARVFHIRALLDLERMRLERALAEWRSEAATERLYERVRRYVIEESRL